MTRHTVIALLFAALLGACTPAQPELIITTPTQPPTPTPLPAPDVAVGDEVELDISGPGWDDFDTVEAVVNLQVAAAQGVNLTWRYDFESTIIYDRATAVADAEVIFQRVDPSSGVAANTETWNKISTPGSYFLVDYPGFEDEPCVVFTNDGQWLFDPSPNGLIQTPDLITENSFRRPVEVVAIGEEIAGQPTVQYRSDRATIGGTTGEADIWLWQGTDVVARLHFEDGSGNVTGFELLNTSIEVAPDLPRGCVDHSEEAAPEVRRPILRWG